MMMLQGIKGLVRVIGDQEKIRKFWENYFCTKPGQL
jgi:hypothetical protein